MGARSRLSRLLPGTLLGLMLLAEPAGAETFRRTALPTTCGGRDILAPLLRDREARPLLLAAERAVHPGRSLLWRIERPGRPPSHLFGTMHSTDPRLDRPLRRVAPLLDRSRVLIGEIAAFLDPKGREGAGERLRDAALARAGNAVEALGGGPAEAEVLAALAGRGIDRARAERFEPWFLIVTLASPACEGERRRRGRVSLDEALGDRAAARGLPIRGLESVEDQVAVLRRIGGWDPIGALQRLARGQQGVVDMRETMTQAYLANRLDRLAVLSRLEAVLAPLGGSGAPPDDDAFRRALLDERNRRWMAALGPELERGGAFIAVGALHLHGPAGLVAKLRAGGYRVTPLPLR